MLEQLLRLTNSPEYLKGEGNMLISEVHGVADANNMPGRDQLTLKVDLGWKSGQADELNREVWGIVCRGVLDSGRLQSYVGHYPSITLHDEHPVLLNFIGSESTLHLQGPCSNIPALVGALYLAHEQACGHWSKFQNIVYSLAKWMQQKGEAELYLPSSLVEAYQEACRQQGIICNVTHTNSISNDITNLRALIWSQSDFHPPDFKLWQPYVVAECFEAERLE